MFTHPSPYRASLQPRRPCAHSPLVPQHQGYGRVLALLKFTPFPFCLVSARPDLAIPPLISFQASDTCATSLFRYSRKKKMKPFWQHNTLTPPSSPAPNHSTETPLCCKCNSCFSCLPPRPNCQYSLSTFLIGFYCAPLLPACFYMLAIYKFSLSSAFKCINECILHHAHVSTYVGH